MTAPADRGTAATASATAHTQGQLVADLRGHSCAIYPEARRDDTPGLHHDDDRTIAYSDKGAEFGGMYWQMCKRTEADFRRLAACWNACDGIADPTNLRKQRDELLSALADFLGAQDALDNREAAGPNAECHFKLMARRNNARQDLDAAIARVEAA